MTTVTGPHGNEVSEVIRPAAILLEEHAVKLLAALAEQDVSRGGPWNASSSLWQRFDTPWNGPGGTRGTAQLVGSVAVQYDTPTRRALTIYKVTITPLGSSQGWDVSRLCDSALRFVGLTLASCPRGDLPMAPRADPFRGPLR
jgi:hypothetical protein